LLPSPASLAGLNFITAIRTHGFGKEDIGNKTTLYGDYGDLKFESYGAILRGASLWITLPQKWKESLKGPFSFVFGNEQMMKILFGSVPRATEQAIASDPALFTRVNVLDSAIVFIEAASNVAGLQPSEKFDLVAQGIANSIKGITVGYYTGDWTSNATKQAFFEAVESALESLISVVVEDLIGVGTGLTSKPTSAAVLTLQDILKSAVWSYDIFGSVIDTQKYSSWAYTHLSEDDDGDGYSETEGDCDDDNDTIHPLATEICNDNQDNDCNLKRDCDDDGGSPLQSMVQSSEFGCTLEPICKTNDLTPFNRVELFHDSLVISENVEEPYPHSFKLGDWEKSGTANNNTYEVAETSWFDNVNRFKRTLHIKIEFNEGHNKVTGFKYKFNNEDTKSEYKEEALFSSYSGISLPLKKPNSSNILEFELPKKGWDACKIINKYVFHRHLTGHPEGWNVYDEHVGCDNNSRVYVKLWY
jgi:hypothetical protein